MPTPANYRRIADDPAQGFMALQSSKILRNGLGDPILEKREAGWSMTRIAEFFDLDRFTVSQFLANWAALSVEQKQEMRDVLRRNNVWDIAKRTQDLFDKIEKKLIELESNPTLYREYISEQRQVLAMAASLLKDVAKLDHQRTIVRILLEEIALESHDVRDRILARIRGVKDLSMFIGGTP